MTNVPIPKHVRAQIVELYQAGETWAEIIRITGVSSPTVARILREDAVVDRRKTSPRAVGEDLIKKIIELRGRNMRISAIAKMVQRDPHTVSYVLADHANQIPMSNPEQISPEEFIVTWQQSSDINEVALKLKMKKVLLVSRANYYRARGVDLKRFQRDGKYHWTDLKKLAQMVKTKEDPEE